MADDTVKPNPKRAAMLQMGQSAPEPAPVVEAVVEPDVELESEPVAVEDPYVEET